ncbi:MAG: ABC transporter permease [Armatimonadota bacterium]
MFERIKSIVIKEFLQVFRDKRLRTLIFIAPVIQLLVFGYAVNMDIKNVPTAFYDMDKSYYSRTLASKLNASDYFDIKYYPESTQEINNLINEGKCTCAIQIDKDFTKDIKTKNSANLQLIVDGTDSNSALIAMSYLQRLIALYSTEIRPVKVNIDIETRAWYNPALLSRNYNVPGVMALLIMIFSVLLTSMAIVREREIGTMEQIMVTPIKPFELILGKTIPFAIISLVIMFLVTVAGVFIFNVPIKGHLYILILGVLVYLLSVLGLGLFLSTIVKNQQQALMGTFMILMPAVLISGFIFPIQNMPKIIQYITYFNPLRYFLVIIRGVFLKGSSFDILWPQFLALFILGGILFTLSSLRFKKRIS